MAPRGAEWWGNVQRPIQKQNSILVQQKIFLGYSASKPNRLGRDRIPADHLEFLRLSKGSKMCDFNFLLSENEVSDSDAGNFAEHISKSRLNLVIEYTC